MPWCPACERFLAPPTVTPEGRCPECRGQVEAGRPLTVTAEGETAPAVVAEQEELGPVPLHLKIFGGAAVVYLGWRLIQGIVWVVQKI